MGQYTIAISQNANGEYTVFISDLITGGEFIYQATTMVEAAEIVRLHISQG